MTHLRNTVLIVVALVATMLYTVASASARPAPNTDNGFAPATPPPVIPHVTSSGLAPWTVVLIAVGSAAVAVLATELWHVYRSHRRIAHHPATA
jgi:hypothetical protein